MMLKISIVCLLLSIVECQELHLCDKAVTGQECEIVCHFPLEGTEMVSISMNTNEVVVCDNSTKCTIKSSEFTESTAHWMDHGNMGMVHFTINKLKIRDQGEWFCSYGKNESEKQTLKIFSAPSSCQLVKVPANDKMNGSLQCQVNCTYPSDSVSVKLFVNDKESTETAKKEMTGNTGCSSLNEKSLVYTWMMEAMEETEYRCECSVQAISWTGSDSIGMKKKPQDGMTTTTIVAIVIVVVVIVIAVIIAILLIKKRRSSKGGAQLATEAEGEKEEL